ncbi:MAG: AbiV family abortive infection protein [Woeseia sp.]
MLQLGFDARAVYIRSHEPRRIADLVQLQEPVFFEAVSEGLALIHENALRIWQSVGLLAKEQDFRSAEILKGLALEEAAKYLILLDAVRCPGKPDEPFIRQLRKFNRHLARGLYTEICDWRPVDLKEVRVGVERECKDYYLDGPNDVDWIFRRDIDRQREEALYVDYVADQTGHRWVSPKNGETLSAGMFFNYGPAAIQIIDAAHKAGIGEAAALEAIAGLWRALALADDTHSSTLRGWNVETLQRLDASGLLEGADDVHHCIAEFWPFPLYDLAMEPVKVKKSELEEIQDRWSPEY